MPPRRAITGRSQEPRKRYREELKALRLERELTLRQLGEVMGWDWSHFGKMESGETLGSPEIAQALDQYYGTKGFLLVLWELAAGDHTQFKKQYQKYMALEAEAVSLWQFCVNVLPGLLQTRGYAREVLAKGNATEKQVAQQVEARMMRRELLEGEGAPTFRVILYEAALRMQLRDTAAWREQLERLVEAAERSNVTIYVLPFSAGPYALDSTHVMFLRLLDGQTVSYTENAHRGQLIEEPDEVERLQSAYDSVRDQALSPDESRTFILRMLEEMPCDPSN